MVNIMIGRLRNYGSNGYAWTSQSGATRAYRFGFDSYNVDSSFNDVRWAGYHLRCLAR